MARRRGANEGSVYQRADGLWTAAVNLGYAGGKRQRRTLYAHTRQAVARKLTEALKARQDGLPVTTERQTVGSFLEQWLDMVRPSLRPQTWTRYEQLVRIHALPALGRLRLSRLRPEHLQELYADRLASGQAPASVRQLHAVLHRALKQAMRWGLVARNVGDLVSAPRVERREMQTLDPEQARAFLAAAKGERLEALYVLALTTGMRLGELRALRWRDVDLTSSTVHVRGAPQRTREGLVIAEPKTARSRRQIELTNVAVDALRRHRAAQNEERLRLGTAWTDLDLAFPNEVGDFLSETHLRRRSFFPLLEQAELPRIRFHELRHTAATLMLKKGIHAKIVQEILGHSTIAITLDLYSHVTPTMQREAAVAMDSVLRG